MFMAQLLTVVAQMKAKAGKEEELRKLLLGLIEPTRKEQGCVQYDLHVHIDDPSRFVFYENWESKEDLDRHSAAPHMDAFRHAAAHLLAEPPSVERYWRIA
jgi:quinol monooxygenase YgiN